jgi:phage shock protein A
MEKMETKVQEREARAAALSDLSSDTLEKQFKNLEHKTDVDMELLALKQKMGKAESPKLSIKEPALLEMNEKVHDDVEAQEVREIKD